MWSPTHIQVTVLSARGLLTKGKNGTNNCFVTIALGKEKYQTSVKEKATQNVNWREECELLIPEHGNRAELILTCLHRKNLGIDEFLGQIILPLNEMDVYERPRSRWYKLMSKQGQEKKDKNRGEIEVCIAFTIKSGSLSDLSKPEKNKSSTLGLGGSLLSLNALEKRKSLKKFAKSIGSRMHINSKKKDKDTASISSSISSLSMTGSNKYDDRRIDVQGDADPGVISEDDYEFVLDNLSNKSSASSINAKAKNGNNLHSTPLSPSPLANQSYSSFPAIESIRDESNQINETPRKSSDVLKRQSLQVDEWEAKLYGKYLDPIDSIKRKSWEIPKTESDNQTTVTISTNPFEEDNTNGNPFDESNNINEVNESPDVSTLPRDATKDKKPEKRFANKLKYFRKEKNNDSNDDSTSNKHSSNQRIIIGHENDILGHKTVEVPPALAKKYDGKTREEMMLLANNLENEVKVQRVKIKEMEDYLDNLLLRVMETHPKILQNPYRSQTSVKSG